MKLSLNHYLVALACRLFRLNAKPKVSGRWEKVKVPGVKLNKSRRDGENLQTPHRVVPQAREWDQQPLCSESEAATKTRSFSSGTIYLIRLILLLPPAAVTSSSTITVTHCLHVSHVLRHIEKTGKKNQLSP